jgi:hypothetical protein
MPIFQRPFVLVARLEFQKRCRVRSDSNAGKQLDRLTEGCNQSPNGFAMQKLKTPSAQLASISAPP